MFPSIIRYTVAPDPTKTSYTYLPALTLLVSVEPRDISIEDLRNNIYEIPRYDCNEIPKIFNI